MNLSRNQLFTNGKRLVVELPDDLQGEAVYGGGSKICGQKQNYFFRLVVQFSEKLREVLYIGYTDYRCRKIFQNGASFVMIQIFVPFLGQNFQVFPGRDLEENNLGNYLLGVENIIPARIFPISLYFLKIEIAIFV